MARQDQSSVENEVYGSSRTGALPVTGSAPSASKGGQLTQATWLRGSAAFPWRRLPNRVLPQHWGLPQHRNGRFK